MRALSQSLLNRSRVITATVLFAVSCVAVGILGYVADLVTVRGHSYGISEEATKLLEVVSVVLNVYLMPLLLMISLLAALNVWFSIRARRTLTTGS